MKSLTDAITSSIDKARTAENGRHAEIFVNDGPLRQTVIALREGTQLGEHNSPPAASLQMLYGAVRVTGETEVILERGALAALTHHRHSVTALEDCVFLLTTVTSVPGKESYGGPGTITGQFPKVEAEISETEQAATEQPR